MSTPPERGAALRWPVLPGMPRACLPERMAPLTPADGPWPGTAVRPSAVMMLFIRPAATGEPARIVLIRRSTTVGTHKGQIGFAGGRADPGDSSPAATALRELEEELALPSRLVTTLGLLPPADALGHPVYPVVGVAAVDLADLKASPAEVEAVFADPWPVFAAGRGRDFRFNIFGTWRTSHLYPSPGGTVWGLTAKLLDQAALA